MSQQPRLVPKGQPTLIDLKEQKEIYGIDVPDLRQAKPENVGGLYELKSFVEIQWVRLPPGKD